MEHEATGKVVFARRGIMDYIGFTLDFVTDNAAGPV
jgi:hypothetical protein